MGNVLSICVLVCRAFLAFFCLFVVSWLIIVTNQAFSEIVRIYQTLKCTYCTLPFKCIKIWFISRTLKTLCNIIFINVSILRTFNTRFVDCIVHRIIFRATYTTSKVVFIKNCIFWTLLTILWGQVVKWKVWWAF